MASNSSVTTAEQRFREAFQRLKANKPTLLEPGTAVTQNNVAREAGCDPSALRKTRFPSLIREIQAHVEIRSANLQLSRQKRIEKRAARSNLTARIREVSEERDSAQSKLVSAHQRIVELMVQVSQLEKDLAKRNPPPLPFGTRPILKKS